MSIQRFFQIAITFLVFMPFAQGQIITKDQVKPPKVEQHVHDHDHAHEDGAYHCGGCDQHLFDSGDATVISDTDLHYHGIGVEGNKSSFHCAGCGSHLGYVDHDHNHYEVLNKSVDKNNDGKFYCSGCKMPLFDLKDLRVNDPSTASSSSSFFNAPISKERLAIDKKDKFYKIDRTHLNCKNCNSTIGSINRNNSGGIGLGLKLDKLKKHKIKN